MKIGSPEKPLRVAIVGSGPSGFYAAEALLKAPDANVRVDLFDRLPTPYGLVRGGVAPDHQKIKGVAVVYEKVAQSPQLRFFGNVKVGQDLSADELRARYDQIVYAVGNESDRHLGIPGEDLKGSHSATAFVGWYNGHPDHQDHEFDLTQENAAVIGVGNVAMDVTRILAQDPEHLAKTDIAAHALEALRLSRVKTIWLLGRRGPAQAAFSPAEIHEIGELPYSDLVVVPDEVLIDEASRKDCEDAENKKNVDYLQERAKAGEGSRPKKVRLRFCLSPVELVGKDGRVEALRVEKNELVSDGRGGVKAVGTGRFEMIPAGLIFRSVGYRGVPIPGVPFDQEAGRVPNLDGRVLRAKSEPSLPGEYVVGWAKRGPSGLIGTNRADSVATVALMLADARALRLVPKPSPDAPEEITALLARKKVKFVSFSDWKALDRAEIERGRQAGKIREKFTRVAEMISTLG